MTGVSGGSASQPTAGADVTSACLGDQLADSACLGDQLAGSAGLALAARLDAVDVASADDHDVLDAIAGWERVASWVAARQAEALAEFARRPARIELVGEDAAAVRAGYATTGSWVREFADAEVSAALHVSSVAASARLRTACALQRLPVTRAALAGGRIDAARARVVTEELVELDPETARQVEAAHAEPATRLTASRLRSRLRAAVLAADPAAARQRECRAHADRRVVISPAADGMADLWAHLPAVDAMAIKARLGDEARRSRRDAISGDDRTMDARRADALVELVTGSAIRTHGRPDDGQATNDANDANGATGTNDASAANGATGATGRNDATDATGTKDINLAASAGDARAARDVTALTPKAGSRGRIGVGVELQVTIAASTLLGLDDAPAQLPGYGPITAETARELAPDARWRRLLTDPVSGALLDLGATSYRPSAAQERFVRVRNATCTFPGCAWPSVECDLDHTVPFPAGDTSAANLGPRCRRHHRFKQEPSVTVSQDPDGTTRWTLPTGHRYVVPPPAIGSPPQPLDPHPFLDPDPFPDPAPDADLDPPPDPFLFPDPAPDADLDPPPDPFLFPDLDLFPSPDPASDSPS